MHLDQIVSLVSTVIAWVAVWMMWRSTTKIRNTYRDAMDARDAMLAALQHVVGVQARALIEAGLYPFGDPENPRHLDS